MGTVQRTDGTEIDFQGATEILFKLLKDREKTALAIEHFTRCTVKAKKLDGDTIHAGHFCLVKQEAEGRDNVKEIYPCKVIQLECKKFFFKKYFYIFVLTEEQSDSIYSHFEKDGTLLLRGYLYGEDETAIPVGSCYREEYFKRTYKQDKNTKIACLWVMNKE